ncbi:carboxymuconolactone decarboxylase family protein [Rhizobium aethiopicum]
MSSSTTSASQGAPRAGGSSPRSGISKASKPEPQASAAVPLSKREWSFAVTTRCDGCIAVHAKKVVELGASEGEIAEALAWRSLSTPAPRSPIPPACSTRSRRCRGGEGSPSSACRHLLPVNGAKGQAATFRSLTEVS